MGRKGFVKKCLGKMSLRNQKSCEDCDFFEKCKGIAKRNSRYPKTHVQRKLTEFPEIADLVQDAIVIRKDKSREIDLNGIIDKAHYFDTFYFGSNKEVKKIDD